GQVECVSSSGFRGGLPDRREEDVRALGEERVADPAVGKLAGEPQVGRSERGDVDRYVGWRHQGPDAAALAGGKGEVVHVAVVLESLASGDPSNDLDRLARSADR